MHNLRLLGFADTYEHRTVYRCCGKSEAPIPLFVNAPRRLRRTWTLNATLVALATLPWLACAGSHSSARPLRIVSEIPAGERPMLLDVRGLEHKWDGSEMSLDEYELLNGATGTRRWELAFVVTPDSSALQLGSRADHAYLSVHTPVARTSLRVAINDTNSVVLLASRFEKPAGPGRILLRWDLADSTGRPLPTGWYWVEASGPMITTGMVRRTDQPLPLDLQPIH